MRVIEYIGGHYDVEAWPFGQVYAWRPESVVVECMCGQRAIYSQAEVTEGRMVPCPCGEVQATYALTERPGAKPGAEPIAETEVGREDRLKHPWRYWKTSPETGLPY